MNYGGSRIYIYKTTKTTQVSQIILSQKKNNHILYFTLYTAEKLSGNVSLSTNKH